MLKILYAGCTGLSPVILAQFTLEMYVAAENCEKFTNHLFLGFKVIIDITTPGKLFSSACYDKQQVCVYLQPFAL